MKTAEELSGREVTRDGVTKYYKRGASMWNAAFLWIFSRGIELGVIVLCMLPVRMLLRKKVPRLFSYLLWGALPVNIVFNLCMRLIPGVAREIVDHVDEKKQIEIGKDLLVTLKWIWTAGVIVILFGILLSYIRFHAYLIGSIRWKENIYLNGRIRSPFTAGVFYPKIYLPTWVDEAYYESVILHEQVHIKRKDIWMKYLAMIVLAVFWFQPILWFCFHMFINDMEEACDEAVLRKKGSAFRTEYATALLEVADGMGKVKGVALGYGSGEIRARILHIMYYERANSKVHLQALSGLVLFMVVAVFLSWQNPNMVKEEQEKIVVRKELSVETLDVDDEVVSNQD